MEAIRTDRRAVVTMPGIRRSTMIPLPADTPSDIRVPRIQLQVNAREVKRPAYDRKSKTIMDNAKLIVVAMAEECRSLIQKWETPDLSLPKALQPKHLLWMCNTIEAHADVAPATRLHRWIGFLQCAMMAHRMLDLDGAKAMFDKAKIAHGESTEDLLDHLNPQSGFELDIGGEG